MGDKMTKYRKKPIVIEATQWFKPGDHPAVIMQYVPGYTEGDIPWIKTLEGGHIVTPGDWIITGIKGEHYPCKPDIFEATYEEADKANSETPDTDAILQGVKAGWDFAYKQWQKTGSVPEPRDTALAVRKQKAH